LGSFRRVIPCCWKPLARFVFPTEAEEASRVIRELTAAADRIAAVYGFTKGMGIAAPQIGEGRAAAIVRPPGREPLVRLNPVVLEESAETDEQFEGCLSFFDVRGLVPRALALSIAYDTLRVSVALRVRAWTCPPGSARSRPPRGDAVSGQNAPRSRSDPGQGVSRCRGSLEL
jgi:hypothetical protein